MGPGERREASRLLGVPWVGRGWKAELLGLDVPPLPGEAAFLPRAQKVTQGLAGRMDFLWLLGKEGPLCEDPNSHLMTASPIH